MKKEILLVAGLIFVGLSTINAQDNDEKGKSSIGISLGAALNYYYGPGDRNFGNFEDNRVNYQINGMIGLTLARDNSDHRTMIAAFGGLGFNNSSTLSNIISDQGYVTTLTTQRSSNNFYQLEGGLLIAEVLRISTGVGQQNFDPQTLFSQTELPRSI